MRVRLDNTYGSNVLEVGSATVAVRREGASIDPATLRALTFSAGPSATVPQGASLLSDAVALEVEADTDLAISVYVRNQLQPSRHFASFRTNFLTANGAGDHTYDPDGEHYTVRTASTPIVSAVEVRHAHLAGTVVAIGGSVVDGHGTTGPGTVAGVLDVPTPDTNLRWTDVLAARLRDRDGGGVLAVANAGIGSTTLAEACNGGTGTSAQARLERDVLAQSGVTHVVVYAGTNDLFPRVCAPEALIGAIRDIAARASAAGVRTIVSTVTPRSTFTPEANRVRAIVNTWIRSGGNCSGACDAIVDFDAVLAWSLHPDAMRPEYDSGDTLHPNPAGYAAMAASIDLGIFHRRPAGS